MSQPPRVITFRSFASAASYANWIMADDDSQFVDSSSDEDSDTQEIRDYAEILQSLISSGQVHIMASEYGDNTLPKAPKFKFSPNTTVLDKSEFSFAIKQACGLSQPKRRKENNNNLAKLLQNREIGSSPYNRFSYSNKCKVANRFLPNEGVELDSYGGKAFCGIFSKDGERFITASQDRQIRLYKSDDGSFKLLKQIRARDVGWSIVDVAFSPDRNHFVYSTWSSSLQLCSADGNSDLQEPLCLVNSGRRFCIFSVVFSSDGTELLAGANDGTLNVYNRERNQKTLTITAHQLDVNSVAFADETSHIIYSGGDDGLVKVWDTRALQDAIPKPVGTLAGHMDGVTHIDSKQDSRYLISNSKDQSIKLWDVRVFSTNKAVERTVEAVRDQNWDYRWQEVPKKLYMSKLKVDGDTSVMTYRGHVVVKTLLRCRFSPLETTGQRYIYTGCGLGRVVIYDALTGQIAESCKGHSSCVRDVSWHPYRSEILSSSWDGVVKKWTYNDKMADVDDARDNMSNIRRSLRLAIKRKKQQPTS